MDAALFIQMLHDKHFFDLARLRYKYSAAAVDEMLSLLGRTMYVPLPLLDSGGQPLVYLPHVAQVSDHGMKKLLHVPASGAPFGRQAMEEEIQFSLEIENYHSNRQSIRRIWDGYAPQDEAEARIYGMKRGLDFIMDQQNAITEENLHELYQRSIGLFLPESDRLLPGRLYRHDAVYVVGGKAEHQGLPAAGLPQAMAQLVAFANAKDDVDELHKAAILHFYLAYLHPYFDGNGRTARLLHLWYLVQKGYPSALFIPFSKYIEQSRSAYYRAYEQTEANAAFSGRLDVTPYLAYFAEHVYKKLEPASAPEGQKLELYQAALEAGTITLKEKALWEYVLSAYGTAPFTTKQLERDFGGAAYATIRSFVLKFSKLGLLHAQKYGNKVQYWV